MNFKVMDFHWELPKTRLDLIRAYIYTLIHDILIRRQLKNVMKKLKKIFWRKQNKNVLIFLHFGLKKRNAGTGFFLIVLKNMIKDDVITNEYSTIAFFLIEVWEILLSVRQIPRVIFGLILQPTNQHVSYSFGSLQAIVVLHFCSNQKYWTFPE